MIYIIYNIRLILLIELQFIGIKNKKFKQQIKYTCNCEFIFLGLSNYM